MGISRDRRLFVADREHHRMQVFDVNGKFLEMWPTGHDSAVLAHVVTEDDYVWVADWTTDRLVKYDLNGRYILDIGGHGPQPGQFDGVHQISADQDRNLYVTEVANDRSQKFRPKPNADPAKIVGPMVGGWPKQPMVKVATRRQPALRLSTCVTCLADSIGARSSASPTADRPAWPLGRKSISSSGIRRVLVCDAPLPFESGRSQCPPA
ncbi:MAG: hypothetical protein ABR606_08085 [Vicinamibacterales bacterium]